MIKLFFVTKSTLNNITVTAFSDEPKQTSNNYYWNTFFFIGLITGFLEDGRLDVGVGLIVGAIEGIVGLVDVGFTVIALVGFALTFVGVQGGPTLSATLENGHHILFVAKRERLQDSA